MPSGEPIGPVMRPVSEPGVLSPWRSGQHHPYTKGVYEVEFDTAFRIRLVWNGRAWLWCSRTVTVSRITKWRGVW